MYITDSTGHRLSLIATNNVRSQNSLCDIVKVPSIEGVYLINTYDDAFVKLMREEQQNADSGRRHSQRSPKLNYEQNLDKYKRTSISFDTGSTWTDLEPPKEKFNGRPFKCEYKCSLHLHMFSSQGIPRAYSIDSALGLIIGHGNVGPRLSHKSVGVFLSRNGGYSWTHVADGVYIYEIGNSGGFIVMAKYGVITDEIEFSYDFGMKWIVRKLPGKKKILVKNIIMFQIKI